jgi:murein DD-endopeptidase MepM/ murein hydrolase activator NlpD
MPVLTMRISITALFIMLATCGCSVYEKYGYGRVARSKLDQASITPVQLPVIAPSISQRYRPMFASAQSEHKGFDILVPSRTPVLAPADGEVSKVALSLLYGNQLILNHGRTAAGYRIQTRYFHLDEQLMEVGENVRRGQLVGYSGVTGLAGLYPHLHFEVHQLNDDDIPVAIRDLDPQLFWFDGKGKVTCYESARDFTPTPVSLSYPVPCRDLNWQP